LEPPATSRRPAARRPALAKNEILRPGEQSGDSLLLSLRKGASLQLAGYL